MSQPSVQVSLASVTPSELIFPVQVDKEGAADIVVDNLTDSTIAYKVKTTAPDKYQVRPIQATIPARGRGICRIVMKKVSSLPDFADPKQTKHKFQVQVANYPEGSPEDLTTFWKSGIPPPEDHRISARLVPSPSASTNRADVEGIAREPRPSVSEAAPVAPSASASRPSASSIASSSSSQSANSGNASSSVNAVPGPSNLPSQERQSVNSSNGSASVNAMGSGVGDAPGGAIDELNDLRIRFRDLSTEYNALMAYSVKSNVECKELTAQVQKLTNDLNAATAQRDQMSKKADDLLQELTMMRRHESERRSSEDAKTKRELELGQTIQGKLQLPVTLIAWQVLAVAFLAFLLGVFFF